MELDPLAVLRRIAFLLEREHASTYRVRAYRNAALAISRLTPAELRRRAQTGTLTELKGIGDKTASVITDALEGRQDYLDGMEAAAGPLVAGGEQVRAALKGDLHLHSDWSDGGSPIEEMAITALELGHEYCVLTDHSPQLTVARGLTAERLASQVDIVRALDARLPGFRLLTGIEVDILDDGTLDQDEELLADLDVVVASVHSKLRMDASAMTPRMLAAVRHPQTNVLGHCTGRMVGGGRGSRPPSNFDARAVFEACAEHEVAVEINSRPERQDPPDELVTLALEIGCLFSIDSDAHAPGQLEWQVYGCERAERLGVPTDRIVNTWPVERLLAWSGSGDSGGS